MKGVCSKVHSRVMFRQKVCAQFPERKEAMTHVPEVENCRFICYECVGCNVLNKSNMVCNSHKHKRIVKTCVTSHTNLLLKLDQQTMLFCKTTPKHKQIKRIKHD